MKFLILSLLVMNVACASDLDARKRLGESFAIYVNNSWGDTLAEGDVTAISHKSRWRWESECVLYVEADAFNEATKLIAWERYDVCKRESLSMDVIKVKQ